MALAEFVRCQVASRSLHSHEPCGDQHLVSAFENGVLLAVADGLGHGHEAAQASLTAMETLRQHPSASLEEQIRVCHRALRNTRGAAITLVQLCVQPLGSAWVGIGNVEAFVLQTNGGRQRILHQGGVVGYNLPSVRPSPVTVQPGDFVVLASDGLCSKISTDLMWHQVSGIDPGDLLDRYAKGTDDALILIAEILGTGEKP